MAIVRYYARPVAIPLWEVVREGDGVSTALQLDPMPEAEAHAKAMQLTRENDRQVRALRDATVADLEAENARLRTLLDQRRAVARLARSDGSRFVPPPLSNDDRDLVDRFVDFAYNLTNIGGTRTYFTTWLGYEMFKWPTDLWSYQDIIARTRPDVIVETGTYRGGSALFLASICDLMDHGEVLSVDVDTSLIPDRPKHPRITYFDGSSIDPNIVSAVERIISGRRAMVILDSDHRRDHVLAELRAYEGFVTRGNYLIVEDTIVNGHPTYPDFGPGPWEAVETFIEDGKDFTVDRSFERVFLTQNRRGYLFRHA